MPIGTIGAIASVVGAGAAVAGTTYGIVASEDAKSDAEKRAKAQAEAQKTQLESEGYFGAVENLGLEVDQLKDYITSMSNATQEEAAAQTEVALKTQTETKKWIWIGGAVLAVVLVLWFFRKKL